VVVIDGQKDPIESTECRKIGPNTFGFDLRETNHILVHPPFSGESLFTLSTPVVDWTRDCKLEPKGEINN